jgi:hypothetical protein
MHATRHVVVAALTRIVDARVLDLLKMKRTDDRSAIAERFVALFVIDSAEGSSTWFRPFS